MCMYVLLLSSVPNTNVLYMFLSRWLRLLFGREFPIQDLLLLWDTIFAGGQPFLLVDYIFVAMLGFIRDLRKLQRKYAKKFCFVCNIISLVLSCDYTGCLHYLMRYPPVADVHSLLALSLHLQDPKVSTNNILCKVIRYKVILLYFAEIQ